MLSTAESSVPSSAENELPMPEAKVALTKGVTQACLRRAGPRCPDAHRAGELICIRSLQLELLAVLACQEVSLWVKLEGASDGQGCDNLKWR